MIAGIISSVAGLLPSVLEAYSGYENLDEAEKKKAALGDAPKFTTPDSQVAFEEGMRKRMGKNMPGYSQMESDINTTAATGMGASARVSGSQVGAMGGANRSMVSRKRQLRQLGVANLQSRDTAKSQYGEAVKSGVQYDMVQGERDWLEWQMGKNEVASLRGWGQQQLMNGVDSSAANLSYGMNLMDQNQYYNKQMQNPYMQTQQSPYVEPGQQTGNIEDWMTKPF